MPESFERPRTHNVLTSRPAAPEWSPPKGFVAIPSQVPGIEVYAPAPEEQAEETKTFKCRHCGGVIAYSAAERRLACPYCGRTQDVDAEEVGRAADQFEFTLEAMARPQYGWGEERRELVCESCGAVVAVAPRDLTNTCAFCGSNRVLTRAAEGDVLRPTALIPFAIDQPACQARVAEWLGRGWMHPAELRGGRGLRELAGIYLPYWTFDAETRATWKAEVGTPRTVTYRSGGQRRTRTEIRWRWRSGRVRLPFNDHLVAGTKHVSHSILRRVIPFDLDQLAEYDPGYLAGWQAHKYDVALDEAWELAKAEIRESTRHAARRDTGSPHVRNFRMTIDFADERWRYVLLPVYLSSYRFGERVYQVMVNGQTGRVAGHKPVDWRKVWLVIAAVFLPGACLGLLGLVTLPLGGVGAGLLAIGFVLLAAALIAGIVIFTKARGSEQG